MAWVHYTVDFGSPTEELMAEVAHLTGKLSPTQILDAVRQIGDAGRDVVFRLLDDERRGALESTMQHQLVMKAQDAHTSAVQYPANSVEFAANEARGEGMLVLAAATDDVLHEALWAFGVDRHARSLEMHGHPLTGDQLDVLLAIFFAGWERLEALLKEQPLEPCWEGPDANRRLWTYPREGGIFVSIAPTQPGLEWPFQPGFLNRGIRDVLVGCGMHRPPFRGIPLAVGARMLGLA